MPSSEKHSRKDKDKERYDKAEWHVKTLDEIKEEKKRKKEVKETQSKDQGDVADLREKVPRQKHPSSGDDRMEEDEDDALNIQPPQAKPGSHRDSKHRKEDKRKHGRSHSRDKDRKRRKRSRSAEKSKSRSKDADRDRERDREHDRRRDRDSHRSDGRNREKKAHKEHHDEPRSSQGPSAPSGRGHSEDVRQGSGGGASHSQQADLRQMIIDRREEFRQVVEVEKGQREPERRVREVKKEGDHGRKEREPPPDKGRREERHHRDRAERERRDKEEKREGRSREESKHDTSKDRGRSRREELVEEKRSGSRPSSKERTSGTSRHDDVQKDSRSKEDHPMSGRERSPHRSSRDDRRRRDEKRKGDSRDSDQDSEHRRSKSKSLRMDETDRPREESSHTLKREEQMKKEEEEEEEEEEYERRVVQVKEGEQEQENASSSSEEEESEEEEEEEEEEDSSEAESESEEEEEEGEEASSSEEEEESAEEGEASADELEEGEHKDTDEEEEEEEEVEEGEEEEEDEEEEESGEEKSDSEESDSESDSESEEESDKSGSEASHHEEKVMEVTVKEEKQKESPEIYTHHAKSKFDDDSPSPSHSRHPPATQDAEEHLMEEESETEYLQDTPPASPLELEEKLPPYLPAIQGCRSVEEFQCLNRIAEGTYGVVYRAKEKKKKNEIVALKRLKMEKEKEGFPITSLREISTLLKAQHRNIVTVREIVVGSNMDKIYIVMDYVEHDLKSLMETMKQPFTIGETKCLMLQLLRGVHHLHDNWILHRDLKTSNLLLNHQGCLKIGDFGLAREYGSPIKPYTSIVVTLWYRAPELLLGTKVYSTPIDMWSVGCIFAEFLTMKPIFNGRSEIDQLNRIFKELGTPSEKIWPGYNELPAVKKTTFAHHPYNNLRSRFGTYLTDIGFELLNRFLTYDPGRRVSAEDALKHTYFSEAPQPIQESMFPTWPAKSEMVRTNKPRSPQAPEGGQQYAKLEKEEEDSGFRMALPTQGSSAQSVGFSLKF